MAMESIEELFEHELNDILGGEQALVDALEQMAQESSDRDIKKAYTLAFINKGVGLELKK